MDGITSLEIIQLEDRLHRLQGGAQAIGKPDEAAFAAFIEDANALCARLKGGDWVPKALIKRMLSTITCFNAEAYLHPDTEASMIDISRRLTRLLEAMLSDRTLEDLPTGPRIS